MKLAWLALIAGCALTSKAKPATVHYYAPPVSGDTQTEASTKPTAAVRLGRITASNHLGYSIAYRMSPVEVRLYDLDRWTDTPDAYAKRSLERALFGDGDIAQTTHGDALTVNVEVSGFEQVSEPDVGGRVQLRFEIHDDKTVIASDVVTVVRKARSASLQDVVSAIGAALDEASAQVADRIVTIAVAHPVHPDGPDDVSGHRVSRRR